MGRHPTPMYIIERIRELLRRQLETKGEVNASEVHRQVNQEGMPVSHPIVWREAKALGLEMKVGGARPGGGRRKGSKAVNVKPRPAGQKNKPGGGRPAVGIGNGTKYSPHRDLIIRMRKEEKTPKGDPLPHGDIAARLGVSRQFVSRVLKEAGIP